LFLNLKVLNRHDLAVLVWQAAIFCSQLTGSHILVLVRRHFSLETGIKKWLLAPLTARTIPSPVGCETNRLQAKHAHDTAQRCPMFSFPLFRKPVVLFDPPVLLPTAACLITKKGYNLTSAPGALDSIESTLQLLSCFSEY
jgi:hypothetical protein